jgi:N-acetylglucosaminyl-diphospho-decaprenol L-rhamnosyltransferase
MLSNLTVVIVTYKTDEKILRNCINSIDNNVNIKLIENSQEFNNKFEFERDFKNLSILCTGKNLGYGAGNNFGLKNVNTKFALISNPDTVYEKDFFENIKNYLNNEIDFSIIGAQYRDNSVFASFGFFEENKKNNLQNNLKSLAEVDWVVGYSMLLNLSKFQNEKIFDENFFLYFEEFDLCKQIKSRNEKIYSSNRLIVSHLGSQGSFATDKRLRSDAQKLREWHWMWSTFYFYKKNYSFLFALKKTLGKLIRALLKILYYQLTFNNDLKTKYISRLKGLLNSMLGKKSWYRVGSKYQ